MPFGDVNIKLQRKKNYIIPQKDYTAGKKNIKRYTSEF